MGLCGSHCLGLPGEKEGLRMGTVRWEGNHGEAKERDVREEMLIPHHRRLQRSRVRCGLRLSSAFASKEAITGRGKTICEMGEAGENLMAVPRNVEESDYQRLSNWPWIGVGRGEEPEGDGGEREVSSLVFCLFV